MRVVKPRRVRGSYVEEDGADERRSGEEERR